MKAKEKEPSKTTEVVETEAPPNEQPLPLSPMTVIKQAITSGAGVDVLERLLLLQERYEGNQARKAYDAALAALRNDLPAIIKNREVSYNSARGHTSYKYEDLHAVVEVLSPVLAKHWLSFRWRTQTGEADSVTVICIVSHRDGHSEETSLTAKNDNSGMKNPIQAMGSAITYLQRYTLKAALGVAAANDDDATSVGQKTDTGQAPEKSEKTSPGNDNQPSSQGKQGTNGQNYKFTKTHQELKNLIAKYIKEQELTPDYEAKILKQITKFDGNKGKPFHGTSDYSKISEKLAVYAIKQFKKAVENEQGQDRQEQEPGANG